MESNEKQVKYANILDIIDGMKQDVVNTSMQQLLITGTMPEIAQNELKVLSQITGAVFNGIISIGTEVYEDDNNNGLVYTKINGKKYSCARINISNSVSITSKPLSASEAYSMTTSSVENDEEKLEETAKKVSIKEFETPLESVEDGESNESSDFESGIESKNDSSLVEEPASYEEEGEYPSDYTSPSYEFSPSQLDEASEFGDDASYDENDYESNDYEEESSNQAGNDDDLAEDDDFEEGDDNEVPAPRENIDELLDDDDFGDISSYEEPEHLAPPAPVVEEKPEKVEVRSFARSNIWEEEPTKDVSTMVYSVFKLTVAHIGGGRPEEVIVMMAPLKISRVSAPAVPIIVTIYHRGKVVTKSSYDMGDGGKSIVTLDINEFYFLCRGSFDEEGRFKAFITTTGQSSQQGDRINVISSKNYGNSQDPETKNGHVKMKYESESGEGTIEVFPFGTSDDDEFVIMVKNPEFCDTYYINQNGRTGTSAIIYGADCKLEVVPNWNGDVLEVEVFEK